jgi:adenosine kinase
MLYVCFVSGFLAQLLLGKPLDKCIECGMYVGNIIVQQPGFTLPDKPEFQSNGDV